MTISRQEFERRYAGIRHKMEKDELDCLLVVGLSDDFNRGNIRYITGSGRGGCCFFPYDGRPVLLTGPNQSTSPKMRKTASAFDLLELRETADPIEQVKRELTRLYKGNRVGIVGMSCISAPMYLAVNDRLQDRLADSTEIFEQMRSIKSLEEIEKIRKAAQVADQAYVMLKESIRPGLSDYELYGEIKKVVYGTGCEYSFDLIDAEGTGMNMTYWPTGETLEANGTLFVEITPAYEGYYAQLPVTLPVLEFSPDTCKMVNVWKEANQAALKILRPGTIVSDLYQTLINAVRAHGYLSPLRPGHAIGLDVLDSWSITESTAVELRAGMVVAVHPAIMSQMWGSGCGMGYTYLITENGAERLSKVDLASL
ncbi:MAG: M24 family metallopeptidase [Syntrophorhabdales bacterium]|jgi:Xaa-Pro aminopeptidase